MADDPGSLYAYDCREDERTDWRLTISDLARLHSFEQPVFRPVDPSVEALSGQMVAFLMGGEHVEYTKWLNHKWKRAFGGSEDKDVHIESLSHWRENVVPWYAGTTPEWAVFSESLAAVPAFGGGRVFRRNAEGSWEIHIHESLKDRLIPLYHFLHNQALELYAWRALRQLLPPHYNVQHSVRVRGVQSRKEFEIDVTAVLGYQLLAVTCTMSSNYGTCKRKAFEVIHRARQLGGDRARAALVCLLYKTGEGPALEMEVNDELDDPAGMLLKVFGMRALDDAAHRKRKLTNALHEHLKRLGWNEFGMAHLHGS
jgi:hypothetical protein